MRIVYFGTPQLAAEMLKAVAGAPGAELVAVVTQPDRPRGRSKKLLAAPVKECAQALALPVLQPERASTPEFTEQLRALNADLFVVVAYGEILRQDLLDVPSIACINVHFSLLPQYRGAAPMQHSLLHGDKRSGCSIIHMARKMDAGDIVAMKECEIGINTTRPELEAMLTQIGIELLLDVLEQARREGALPGTPQDSSLVSFAPKIETSDCQIDWTRPAQDLHNLVRAVTPQPGAWCTMRHQGRLQRLKILKTELVEEQGEPGTHLSFTPKNWCIACGKDAIRLLEIQPEGKKSMPSAAFIAGAQGQAPEFLQNAH